MIPTQSHKLVPLITVLLVGLAAVLWFGVPTPAHALSPAEARYLEQAAKDLNGIKALVQNGQALTRDDGRFQFHYSQFYQELDQLKARLQQSLKAAAQYRARSQPRRVGATP